MSVGVVVKEYSHYNHALGCYVKNKQDYYRKMKEGGFIDADEAHEIARKAKAPKKYKMSDDAGKLIRQARRMSKENKVIMSSRMIEKIKTLGKK